MNLSRRQLFAASLATVCLSSQEQPLLADVSFALPRQAKSSTNAYFQEASRLNALLMKTFWNGDVRMFRAPVRSAETVDSDPKRNNGYVFWPSLLGLQALVSGEMRSPGTYRAEILTVYAGLEQYYDREAHAYNAWLNYPGNRDRYYDDNGWAVCVLAEAYQATGIAAFRDRAWEIQSKYLFGGWDASKKPGGIPWGTDETKEGTADHNTCSTAASALGAILLAKSGVQRERNLKWGGQALDWLYEHLRDSDNLFFDGFRSPNWTLSKTKWTYNTGAPIRAYVEHYRLTKRPESLVRAKTLAKAANDRNLAFYDSIPKNPEHRFFADSSFFVPYLIDGLSALYDVTKDKNLLSEMRRNADFAINSLRDPEDGLYFRSWRLWKIDATRYEAWKRMTGQEFRLEPDDSERSKETKYEKLPVGERPLVKTLLANAGIARMLWTLSKY